MGPACGGQAARQHHERESWHLRLLLPPPLVAAAAARGVPAASVDHLDDSGVYDAVAALLTVDDFYNQLVDEIKLGHPVERCCRVNATCRLPRRQPGHLRTARRQCRGGPAPSAAAWRRPRSLPPLAAARQQCRQPASIRTVGRQRLAPTAPAAAWRRPRRLHPPGRCLTMPVMINQMLGKLDL